MLPLMVAVRISLAAAIDGKVESETTLLVTVNDSMLQAFETYSLNADLLQVVTTQRGENHV